MPHVSKMLSHLLSASKLRRFSGGAAPSAEIAVSAAIGPGLVTKVNRYIQRRTLRLYARYCSPNLRSKYASSGMMANL